MDIGNFNEVNKDDSEIRGVAGVNGNEVWIIFRRSMKRYELKDGQLILKKQIGNFVKVRQNAFAFNFPLAKAPIVQYIAQVPQTQILLFSGLFKGVFRQMVLSDMESLDDATIMPIGSISTYGERFKPREYGYEVHTFPHF